MSIEEKLQRISALQAEIQQLSQEVEAEYYTPDKLERFHERYRTMKASDVIPLVTVGHPEFDSEFSRCFRYCRARQLYAFSPWSAAEIRQPPLPQDDAHGKPQRIDYDAKLREAHRIRDEAIAKETEERRRTEVPLRPELPTINPRVDQVAKAAAINEEFNSRSQEAAKLSETTRLADQRPEKSRPPSPPSGTPLDEQQAQIAKQTLDMQERHQKAVEEARERARRG
jgi:hypothetical protein